MAFKLNKGNVINKIDVMAGSMQWFEVGVGCAEVFKQN